MHTNAHVHVLMSTGKRSPAQLPGAARLILLGLQHTLCTHMLPGHQSESPAQLLPGPAGCCESLCTFCLYAVDPMVGNPMLFYNQAPMADYSRPDGG